jgi:hypothetical protein
MIIIRRNRELDSQPDKRGVSGTRSMLKRKIAVRKKRRFV